MFADLLDALTGPGTSDVVRDGDLLTLLFVVVLLYFVSRAMRAAVDAVTSLARVMLAIGGIAMTLTLIYLFHQLTP